MSKKVEQALAPSIPPKTREYIKSIIDPAIKEMNERIAQQAEFLNSLQEEIKKETATSNGRIVNMERLLNLQPKSRAAMQELIALLDSQDGK
tara:strand:+ start:8281 stop:8556 length:276 start_codon:yes stop_codon:yes gene_type:complete